MVTAISEAAGGARVIGCRLSGKSAMAEALATTLGARRLDCAGFVPTADANKVDREIASVWASFAAGQISSWVVDDAELLLAKASPEGLRELDEAKKRGLRLLLVRNHYVPEGQGWFADREAAFADLPVFELRPDGGAAGLTVAAEFVANAPREQRAMRARWLHAWSGGLPGLMAALQPLCPEWPDEDTPPMGLPSFIHDLVSDLELEQPRRRRVLALAMAGFLPPAAVLPEPWLLETGYLVASGLLAPDWGRLAQPFQGRLWTAVAHAAAVGVAPSPARYDGLRLEALLAEAGMARELAEFFGCSEDAGSLALALEGVSVAEQWDGPRLSVVLADALGLVGLRMVSRMAGIATGGRSASDLAQSLLRCVERAA